MGSVFTMATRLFWFWMVDTAHAGSNWSTHRSSSSPMVTLAAPELRRTVSSATTRLASRLGPRTVRLTWVGRPWASRPVKARTSYTPTPGERSRTVATDGHHAEKGYLVDFASQLGSGLR